MSTVGKKITDMTFKATGNKSVEFPKSLSGKKTIIYFYPKDDTPGCTIQACSYRDSLESFNTENIQVFGVSSDNMDSHDAFTSKFSLNFPLIVDSDKKLRETLEATGRDSFLIDETGTVTHEWKNVDPKTTVEETLAMAKK